MSVTTAPAPSASEAPHLIEAPRSRKSVIAYAVFSLVALLVFWRGTESGVDVTFNLSLSDETVQLPALVWPA